MMDAETPLLLGQRRPRRPARAALLVAASLALFAAASRSSLARGGALAMVDVSDAPSDDAAQGAPSDAPADDAAQGAPSDDASASIASAGSTVSSTGDDAAPQQEEQGQDEQGQDAALTAPSSAPTAPPSAAAQLQQQGQAAQGQDEQPAQQQDPGQLNASSALAPLGDDDDADAGTQYCNESISKLAFSVSEPAAAHAFVSRYFPVTCEANGGFEGYSLCSHNSSCGAFARVALNGTERGGGGGDDGGGARTACFGLHFVHARARQQRGQLTTRALERAFDARVGDLSRCAVARLVLSSRRILRCARPQVRRVPRL